MYVNALILPNLFRYLLSILTTYVKKNDPELEKVLMIIKDLKGLFVRLFQAPTSNI